MRKGDFIPARVLDAPVVGYQLAPGRLRHQLGEGPTLLVFLRHFGCIFCRETLADLREATESDPGFPDVLLFFQGSPIEGKAFLRRHWPAARAVSDADSFFYDAFGVTRGGLVEMFRPAVWTAKARAEARGHSNGPRQGDIWRMPGAFLVREDCVLWAHEYRHAADHPDYASLAELAPRGG